MNVGVLVFQSGDGNDLMYFHLEASNLTCYHPCEVTEMIKNVFILKQNFYHCPYCYSRLIAICSVSIGK